MSPRDITIDFTRCIMNYMIVFIHAWAACQYVSDGGVEFVSWASVCCHLSGIAVPGFFMISGYLLFRGFSLAKYPAKMMSRVKRLLVPYVLWNLFFVAFYLALAGFVPRLSARVAAFGLDTFAGAFSKVLSLTVAPIDGPLWFLRLVFLLALVSPILWALMRVGRGVVVIALALVWCVAEAMLALKDTLLLIAPAYAVASFVLGGVLAVNGKDLVDAFRHRGWIVAGLAACLAGALIMVPDMVGKTQQTAGETAVLSLMRVLEAPVMIAIAARIDVEKIARSKVYLFFKDMSFFAYAGHFLFCSIWLHALAPFLPGQWPGKLSALIVVFVVFGLATMCIVFSLSRWIYCAVFCRK